MTIQKSAEDYLEAMLMMKEQHGYIRSIDIADHLGVTKPSVSYATKRLRENGFITMDHSGFITLTDSGMEIADRIYSRHKMLTDFFTAIGVSPEIARTDACKVEHDISEETFKAMSRYNEILKEAQKKESSEA
ncbi:metal-dependent transcriptional regulator [Bilifractor sp. LCP21S3_A7]|uniref:metal-dependent transcriptional regulator n=1 Tax=Bilifractor sp. LCP21S3_A7 TaxID=3438738 RepID=UPI003F903A47